MEILNGVQLKRAMIEDEIVDLVLKNYSTLVMHGGTAVWRCYGGNRFSRDVDFYNNLKPSQESSFQKELHKLLTDNGYPVREEKYNNRTNTLHVIFRGEGTTGKLDITFAKAKGIAVEYLRVDGSKRIIRALGPEELIFEKIGTYSSKHRTGVHEMQDLYDIMILKDGLGKPSKDIRSRMRAFLELIKDAPPGDEIGLRQLVLTGIAPSFRDIVGILERWLDDAGR